MNFSMKNKFLVKIFFKSGNSHEAWFTKLETKYEGEKLTKIVWETVDEQNLFWSLCDVEFIQVLKVKKSIWSLFK